MADTETNDSSTGNALEPTVKWPAGTRINDDSTTRQIRVFLVDDHFVVCEGLRQMLRQEEDIIVVGDAQTGEQAIAKLQETSVDVVLLDVRLPGIDGIETLTRIKAVLPALKVIMLTSYGDEFLGPSIEAGATGYLLKRANRAEMVRAIRDVVVGGVPLDSQVTPGLLDRLRAAPTHKIPPISSEETHLLELVAEGLSNKQIAANTCCTESTVKKHLSRVMQKLSANDRAHAVAIALRNGWISNPTQNSASTYL